MKTSIKVALFVVFFIALAGILGALYLYNKKHADMSRVKPDFVISAILLQKEFEDNENAASEKYINKTVEITGTIASVNEGEDISVSVTLNTGSPLSSVICTFNVTTDPTALIPGKEVTIRGECSGYLMDVLLNNCAVIN
jgi:hypothetical protein